MKFKSKAGHEIEIMSDTYGYFTLRDGSEGGGLWFEGSDRLNKSELIDYDGVYELPLPIIEALREHGFIVDKDFE